MDYLGLTTQLGAMGVVPPDVLRASLYIDYLATARVFFHQTLNGAAPAGLTVAGYAFVQNAVQRAALLDELAGILDFYVAPAVDADLQFQYAHGHGPAGAAPWTYRQYFDNSILDANAVTFAQNLAAFRARYPIADQALARLAANFQANIQLCCARVFADRDVLRTFYTDLYHNSLAIYGLTSIKSTGSDFHKGGKQVLILQLNCSYRPDAGTVAPLVLPVVYKPSDLEADCLIAGDAAAINRVTPGFMTQSLFEIYNAALAQNPGFDGLPLDTYRILPRRYNSANPAGAPLQIREAYGYIQFLNNRLEWNGNGFLGFYPSAVSDYVVFQSQTDSVIRAFYRKAGAFCAVAASFSILDMHIENFRVSNYCPYPIDLEISLTSAVADIATTALFGQLGGLSGEAVEGQESHWVVRDADTPGRALLDREYPTVYEANRLYRAQAGQQKTVVPIDDYHLLDGFDSGMRVLRAAQQAGNFAAWIARLDNVVVRYLPFATSDFKRTVTAVFINRLTGGAPGANAALAASLNEQLLGAVDAAYATYVDGAAPNFLAMQAVVASPDFQNLDIPVFYHRIAAGSADVVDSSGVLLPIPDTVAILHNPAAPCRARVGRDAFFANPPTQHNVVAPQVTALGGAGFDVRRTLLQGSMLAALGLDAVPDNPLLVVPDFH